MEIFIDVRGYEGFYKIGSNGTLWSTASNKALKHNTDKDGYRYYVLCVKGKRKTAKAHRLVAEAFIPNPNNLPAVNHKDENRGNNSVENLEWCDIKYNNNYGHRNEKIGASQRNHPTFSKPVICVELNMAFPSVHEASRVLGVNRGNIGSCCLGKKKHRTAGGFHWVFAEEFPIAVTKARFGND